MSTVAFLCSAHTQTRSQSTVAVSEVTTSLPTCHSASALAALNTFPLNSLACSLLICQQTAKPERKMYKLEMQMHYLKCRNMPLA